ncbi:hypothetical protein HYW17_04980 [Candidatus Uhrbacteria bacterium]|nr:hypothetical protein [Candidatus Uhrbacteria bacterium]
MDTARKIEQFDARVQKQDPSILDEARACGAFQAFVDALSRRGTDGVPRRPERFFFHALQRRVERSVTPAVLRMAGNVPVSAAVNFYVSEGIGFVFVDGDLRGCALAKYFTQAPPPRKQPSTRGIPRARNNSAGRSSSFRYGIHGVGDPLRPLDDWLNRATVVDIYQALTEWGLFDPFERIIQHQASGGVVRSVAKHFAFVIRNRSPKPVPRTIRARLADLPAGTRVDYFVSQGLGIVVVNANIREFVIDSEIAKLEEGQGVSYRAHAEQERKPRDPGEAIRAPDDPLRIGGSWVAHEGRMARELRDFYHPGRIQRAERRR